MNDNLLKKLKELKKIQPDPEYSRRSRLLLIDLKSKEEFLSEKSILSMAGVFNILINFYSNRRLALAAGTLGVLTLIIIGGFYRINQLNQDNLVVKASEVNASIQVKLNEIQYLLQNNASSIDANQILTIQAMLQNSAEDLKAALSSKPEELDKALEKLKAAEDMLYQIDQIYGSINK